MSIAANLPTPPPIQVTETDYEVLADLSEALRSDGAAFLRRELERAEIVPDAPAPALFVRLGTSVEYRDLISGRSGRVRLTLPKDADIDAGRLSVATPMGAALLGLRLGDDIRWTGADGRPHAIVVDWIGEGAPAGAGEAA